MVLLSTLLTVFGFVVITASVVLFLRVHVLSEKIVRLEERCEDRLGALERAVEQLAGDDENGDDRADARKRAIEAERRFTEGIANILNFSYNAAGKKGGNS